MFRKKREREFTGSWKDVAIGWVFLLNLMYFNPFSVKKELFLDIIYLTCGIGMTIQQLVKGGREARSVSGGDYLCGIVVSVFCIVLMLLRIYSRL